MPSTEARNRAVTAIPLWVKIVAVVCGLLTGMGAVIAWVQPGMLLQPHAEITTAVRTYAGYLTSRNLIFALMLFALLAAGARRALGNLLAILGLIQVLDGVIDCVETRWTIASGVFILGLIFLVAATRLCGKLWRKAAWL